MLDLAKATQILEHHFATVTPEEFAKNLREFCPELFEDEQGRNLDTETLSEEEIYRKAKEDGKLEIAPKLLQKGFSIEEVATILELDINRIAS
jgi:predicted transposase/invertase (TIGR01784 family)